MLEIPLSDSTGRVKSYSSQNVATPQVATFYDGYFAVVLTGGYRPKYSDQNKRVRFTAVLVACDEAGNINKDFAQVLELGSNLSKIIYTGKYLSVASANFYQRIWSFSDEKTPVLSFGSIVKITSKQINGFVKPFKFDVQKELTPDKENYVIREDLKTLHNVFTISIVDGKTATWATPKKGVTSKDGFFDDATREAVVKHINSFFEQQVEFASANANNSYK